MSININDNIIQPFSLESSNLKGYMIRMSSVLKKIVEQHNYPLPVSYLLSEALTLSLLLSSMIKYNGVFTLQIQAKGAIKTIVIDVNTDGDIRAYAAFDEEAFADNKLFSDTQNYFPLLEKGYMAFTVDQGEHMARHQGIVALEGDSLLESVQHYFSQSEQIETSIRMAIHPQDDLWHAGAIMLQSIKDNKPVVVNIEEIEQQKEDWERASVLLKTCQDDELLSPSLQPSDVLYRLFHEEGVRVYSTTDINHVCRCSKERVKTALKSLSDEDLADSIDDKGQIDMTCEFCGKNYLFNPSDIKKLQE